MRRRNQAIVVIARKLLVAVWQVLTKEETDLHASEEDLAYKMLVLSWDLDETVRMGLTYKQFAKYADTPIQRHVKVKGQKSPYDGDWAYWIDRLGRDPSKPNRVIAERAEKTSQPLYA